MRSLLAVPGALARRARARRSHGSEDTAQPPQDRLAAALALVAEAEALEPALPAAPAPMDFWGKDRVARRPQMDPALTDLLPVRQRKDWSEDAPGVRTLQAPVAADLVVMAKFDINDEVKLRAGYGQERRTLAVQPPGKAGDGIARAVQAHEVVSRHAPGLVPPLLGHGRLAGGLPYLVETWLEGEPLLTGARLAEAAPEILTGLAAVHRGHGITLVRLSQVWAQLRTRWTETMASGLVPEDLGRWVEQLVARDGTLRRSWVHGDLVASNAMRTDHGVVLIDWEYAQEAPIMNDGAKLHLFSAEPDRTLEQLLEAFADPAAGYGGGAGAEAYRPVEELALAHASMISRYPQRRAALEGHPRAKVYDKQVRRQVDRLAQVHAAA